MLTSEDFEWPPKRPKDALISLAFGIDGEIVYTLVTYVNFYELLTKTSSIRCKSDNCDVVEFWDESDNLIETLQAGALFGSVLASSPKIFVLVRRSKDNSTVEFMDERPWYRKVEPGWKYDESGILPL